MVTNKIILSIIIPIFNHKDEVGVMIDSIRNNTFNEWELLAIDDGSDEETLRLISTYMDIDPRIKLIKRVRLPKGAPTCRNIGIENSSGKYIVFFDSDDFITPECLFTRVQQMELNPVMDFMVFPSGLFINNTFYATAHKNCYGYKIAGNDIKEFARRTLPFIVWNNIYKKESIVRNKLYWEEELLSLQDADYNIQAITKGLKYKYASEMPDYGYRIYTKDSISKKINTIKHYKSHELYLTNTYRHIQAKYGHKYDYAIFEGILLLYNSINSGKGNDNYLALIFSNVLNRFSPIYGTIFNKIICISKALEKVLPSKRARQLSMLGFLLVRQIREIRRIKKIDRILIRHKLFKCDQEL